MSMFPNIKSQLNYRLNQLSAIGESKVAAHEAYRKSCASRHEKCNPSKSPFEHSKISKKDYQQTITEFCHWAKENKPDIYASKDLKFFDKALCYEYLQSRDSHLSAWTVHGDMSALNKVLDLGLTTKEGHLSERHQEDVTRSRTPKEMDSHYNPKNYEAPIDIANAFGLRRECIIGGDYAIKESSMFTRDDRVYCSTIGKGGRYREAPCLESYKSTILGRYNLEEREVSTKEEFRDAYRHSTDDVLFTHYTTKIDNHAFRGEYARALYAELVDKQESEGAPSYQPMYKGYFADLVRETSNALGHNRLNVVITSYFH